MSSTRTAGTLATGVLALALAAGTVWAQPSTAPANRPAAAAQPVQTVPANLMVRHDANGKIVRYDANADLMALKANPFITDADWERLKPAILEWQADVDRQVIDNVDFVVQFDEGLVEKTDLNDQAKMHEATEMLTQVAAPGPLTGNLQAKGVLNPQQLQTTTRIVSDYQQALMNEVLAAPPGETDEEKVRQANAVSRFLFNLSIEDAMRAYHRQLIAAAGQIDKAIAGAQISGASLEKIAEPAKAAAAATTDEAKIEAMRRIMRVLPLAEQRSLLQSSYELTGPHDPTTHIPDLPPPEKEAAAADQAPAASGAAADASGTFTTPGGVLVEDLKVGTGETVQPNAVVTIHYRGTLKDGTEFDSSYARGDTATFPLARLIKGWQEGIPGMKVGGKRKLTIPWQLAYGERGSPPKIPPRANLIFEIELFDVQNP